MPHIPRFTLYEKGFSLFEILIAIAVFAVVGMAATQIITVSFMTDRAGGMRTVATELAQEAIDAAESAATEKWQNIYGTSKGEANTYRPSHAAADCGSVKWCLVSGQDSISANNVTYTRYLYIENVSRNGAGDIVASGGTDDPSTQKATAVAAWSDGSATATTTLSRYFSRGRNAAAAQTQWVSGGTAPGSGETGTFGTDFAAQSNADITSVPGSLKLSPQ